jgi:hypothetical protein
MSENIGKYVHVNTPDLIKQVFDNPSTYMLRIPFNTMLRFLGAVAERAAEINDPKLNILMLKLNLYDVPVNEIYQKMDECEKLMNEEHFEDKIKQLKKAYERFYEIWGNDGKVDETDISFLLDAVEDLVLRSKQ